MPEEAAASSPERRVRSALLQVLLWPIRLLWSIVVALVHGAIFACLIVIAAPYTRLTEVVPLLGHLSEVLGEPIRYILVHTVSRHIVTIPYADKFFSTAPVVVPESLLYLVVSLSCIGLILSIRVLR